MYSLKKTQILDIHVYSQDYEGLDVRYNVHVRVFFIPWLECMRCSTVALHTEEVSLSLSFRFDLDFLYFTALFPVPVSKLE